MQKYVIEQNSEIYIYGVGRIGRLLEKLLIKNGYSVIAFIDINAASRHYKNYKIITPDEMNPAQMADALIIVALAAGNIAQSVQESLKNAGCRNVVFYSDKRIQEQFCLHTECARCVFVSSCWMDKSEKACKIRLNDLFIQLTTRCSLNCKNCVALTPELKERKIVRDLKIDNFENALKVLERYVGVINEFVLSGGDPLLNNEIAGFIEIILKTKIRFKRICIMTPGTIPIPDELFHWLTNEKITITVDDYGSNLEEK